LTNKRDKQTHSLDENSVFVETKPIKFMDLDELLQSTAPASPAVQEKLAVVCRENNIWPIVHTPATPLLQRMKYRVIMMTAWYEASLAQSKHDGNSIIKLSTAMGVVATAALAIAVVFVLMKFWGQV
jgi:hypothetical protein